MMLALYATCTPMTTPITVSGATFIDSEQSHLSNHRKWCNFHIGVTHKFQAGTVQQQLSTFLSGWAVSQARLELSLRHNYVVFPLEDDPDGFTHLVQRRDGDGATHRVCVPSEEAGVDEIACDCDRRPQSWLKPCRHVFAVNVAQGYPLIIPCQHHRRWRLDVDQINERVRVRPDFSDIPRSDAQFEADFAFDFGLPRQDDLPATGAEVPSARDHRFVELRGRTERLCGATAARPRLHATIKCMLDRLIAWVNGTLVQGPAGVSVSGQVPDVAQDPVRRPRRGRPGSNGGSQGGDRGSGSRGRGHSSGRGRGSSRAFISSSRDRSSRRRSSRTSSSHGQKAMGCTKCRLDPNVDEITFHATSRNAMCPNQHQKVVRGRLVPDPDYELRRNLQRRSGRGSVAPSLGRRRVR
jgi:uncharacterized membrane protein YgcG